MKIFKNKLTDKSIIFFVIAVLFFFQTASAQVNVSWQNKFNSPPNLVDYGREIERDNAGNIFVCGHSFVNGGQEGVTTILKYSDNGNQLWAKFTEVGVNMEDFRVDIEGNLYVSGDKWNGSNFDILLIKFDNEGNQLWRKFYDGGNWDRSFAIEVDNSGNIFQTGITWSQTQSYDIITIKYNPQGDILWNKTYTSAGTFSDYGKRITLDHSGNVYVTGFADKDITLIKYSSSGILIWDRKFNMNIVYNEFFASHIAVDANDNIMLCGTIYNPQTHSDIFLRKYDSSGTYQWTRVWNGPNGNDSDVISGDAFGDEAMALDYAGNIYLTGTTINPAVPFGDNIVTLKFNQSGDLLWSYIYDGPAHDWDRPYSICVSPAGNVYVSGETVLEVNSLVPTDYLTFKLNPGGQLQWIQTFNGVGNFFDKAAAMIIDNNENVYVTGISSQDQELFDSNRDIVTIKYSQSSTGIINSNVIPRDYELKQNFPNPFNPATNIEFEIPHSGFVSLKIYDIVGKEIKTLVNNELDAGIHKYIFDASSINTGVYFYVLKTDDFSQTKKMTLIK